MIGRELLENILAADAAGDTDAMIGYLLVALEKAKAVQRDHEIDSRRKAELLREIIESDMEYHPTTFTGHLGE